MRFDVAVLAAHMVLQLSSGGVERIPDRHIEVLVGIMLAETMIFSPSLSLKPRQFVCVCSFRHVIDNDVTTRHTNLDAHFKFFPLLRMPMRRLDNDSAARDAPAKFPELGCSFAKVLFDSPRWRHVAKGNSDGVFHYVYPPGDLIH